MRPIPAGARLGSLEIGQGGGEIGAGALKVSRQNADLLRSPKEGTKLGDGDRRAPSWNLEAGSRKAEAVKVGAEKLGKVENFMGRQGTGAGACCGHGKKPAMLHERGDLIRGRNAQSGQKGAAGPAPGT